MERPDFGGIVHHSRQREPRLKSGIPQEVPYGTRLYHCECCNDSGVVQAWKLNRWAIAPSDEPLNSTMSLPVFCQQFQSCGNAMQQVFAGDKDKDEAASRTVEVNLLKGNSNGDSQLRDRIAKGKLKVLSLEQSRYIHNKVLEYREQLACTDHGRAYIADVKTACREALPPSDAHRSVGGLTHIGQMLRIPDLPAEPDWDDPSPAPRVEVTSPRDLAPEVEF